MGEGWFAILLKIFLSLQHDSEKQTTTCFTMKKVLALVMLLLGCAAVHGAGNAADEIARLRAAADSLHSIGRTDTAAIVAAEAVRLAQQSGNAAQIVGTRAAQGVFLRSLGRLDEAMESYGGALEIVTSEDFRRNPGQEEIEEAASLYINMAVLNLDTQHKEQAAAFAGQAAQWVAQSNDAQLRSTVYGVAGSVLTGCGDLAGALRYQNLAYDDALECGDTEAAFRASAYAMLIADRLGRKDEAARLRARCTELMPEIESVMARLLYYQAECSICLANGDNRGSLTWFNSILTMDGIDNLPFVKFDCYNNLHQAYAALGDYEEAYSTLLESNELRDSLWENERTESLRELTVRYETKETELALARSEAKRAGTLMWLFAVAALLLIVVLGFLVYANRQRRLRLRQYIEGLENERRRMARELHDGVCNDLLAIRMGMETGKSDTAHMLDACREQVRRISHELMPPEFAYADLDEVVRHFVAKQAEGAAGKISFGYDSSAQDAAWADIRENVALEVYRIIQEAVGNAVKHSGATDIAVELRLEGNTLTAAVRDNGTYKNAGSRGIGLESIRRRAESIKGETVVETGADGTVVRMVVKTV